MNRRQLLRIAAASLAVAGCASKQGAPGQPAQTSAPEPTSPAGPGPIEMGPLSKKGGGPLPGHVSHQTGLDTDIRPQRAVQGEGPVSICDRRAYSRAYTAQLVTTIVAAGADQKAKVERVFFGDPMLPGITYWRGLHNHLHIRMTEEEGDRPEPSDADRAVSLPLKRADLETFCDAKGRPPAHLSPSDKNLIQRALAVPAATILTPPATIADAQVALAGSIADYVTAVASTNGYKGQRHARIVPCERPPQRSCVEIAGDPCASQLDDEWCEGVSLVVSIDLAGDRPSIDRAYGNDLRPVRDQRDVERLIRISP
jgi:hypothetical protein